MKPALLLLWLPLLAAAEVVPPQGPLDPRVRIVDYHPHNVVRLATFYGVSTHVQLDAAETIQDLSIGDERAWTILPRGNHLFIKPLASHADTNVTVVTNLRTYQFTLVVQPRRERDSTAWADPNLVYSLSFRYPEEEMRRTALAVLHQRQSAEQRSVEQRLAEAAGAPHNYDYWVAGSEEVSPTQARDDGRFIYLTFSNNRDMPAVYAVDEQEGEALINTHVADGNTIVVQRMVRRLMLRKGRAVASVVNRSFAPDAGLDNTSGTVSPSVQRIHTGTP